MIINHNIPAIQAYNALSATNSALQKSIQRLSTGLRINSAADDAAGLAISEKMRAQIRGLDRATANAQDGISMIQTAEGALGETHSILQRMRELSVQAANDTLTQEDRGYIQLEIDQLKEEITRIANTTQFNKKKLLDGSAAVLWSSDNLETKAIINGGLRQIDQFGQKAALEGNFKIMINADPGQAEIQKSDIFKIKHKNVIMNLSVDKNGGFQNITVDNLPAGQYNVFQAATLTAKSVLTFFTVEKYSALAGFSFSALNFGGAGAVYLSGTGTTRNLVFVLSPTFTPLVRIGGVIYTPANTGPIMLMSGITVSAGLGANYMFAAGDLATISSVFSASGAASIISGALVAHKEMGYQQIFSAFSVEFTQHNYQFGGFYGLNSSNAMMVVMASALQNLQNASILLEVIAVNHGTGDVTFRAQVNAMDADGTLHSYIDDNLIIGEKGVTDGYNKLGFTLTTAIGIRIFDAGAYSVGAKIVLNTQMTGATTADPNINAIAISATVNKDWPDSWGGNSAVGASKQAIYNMDVSEIKNKDVQFKNFYLNSVNGTVYEGNVVISFNNDLKAVADTIKLTGENSTAAKLRASFEAAYIGQVAKGDVKLRDLDKFWDANGRFMLDDPKALTIYQGDGKNTQITLYATDTLDDVRKKLNDAIAYGLGQSRYVKDPGAEFVSFVDKDSWKPDNPMSVEGTMVIRSLIPGTNGKLNFSGDEDIIKALSLNVIQEAKETAFRVSVADAHDATSVASNVKITGNVLYGIVNPNVDVQFDSMANVAVKWNENTMKFELTKEAGTYETILHLADNTTVFQIGANEGEDMGINIGNMSAHALGVDKVLVTDRVSAARSITVIDNAISKVSSQRAKLGAYQNRLEHTINNLTTAATNLTASESRIRDTDMAKEMMNFTKLNILSQAGNSMLAQANMMPQNILSLLR